jgi:hypothetical protein
VIAIEFQIPSNVVSKMITEFNSEFEYVHKMVEYGVQRWRQPELAMKEFIAEIKDEFLVIRLPRPLPGAMSWMAPVKHWVVRDDDLKLMDSVWSAIIAAAGTSFFQASVTLSAVTGIAAAVFKLARSILKKGVSLDPLQYKILSILRAAPEGLLIDELSQSLNQTLELDQFNQFSALDAETELRALSKVRLRDGSVISLVTEDGRGKWGVNGI